MDIELLYSLYTRSRNISTDTRKISPGSIYFALRGEHFDGNQFASRALDDGAEYAVIDNEKFKKSERFILVPDVLKTLQELAAFHRSNLSIPIIGITGTNGKTTTKELLNSVLSQRFKTHCTVGNLNNHIGVPLTLLSILPDIEVAIVEMGANHQKEIELLCSIAKPDFGLITNIGKAHLEGFGGFEGVKTAKAELYDYIKLSGGLIFVNGDNQILSEMYQSRGISNVIEYGTNESHFVVGTIVANDPVLSVEWASGRVRMQVQTKLTGSYNLENILAAISVGLHFGLSPEEISRGITAYTPGNSRSQIIQTAGNTLICDYYNANPSSMMVAIDNLRSVVAEKRALILGDMFELGAESEDEHQRILDYALSIKADRSVFIGDTFYSLRKAGTAFYYKDVESALNGLSDDPVSGSMVLIKGSRGMKLEKLIPVL